MLGVCVGGGGGGGGCRDLDGIAGKLQLSGSKGGGVQRQFWCLEIERSVQKLRFSFVSMVTPPPPNWITHSRSRRGRRTSRSGLGDLHGVRTTVGNFMERLGTYLG